MALTELIGFTAATLTTIAFLPQVIKTWKDKSTKDISLITYSLFVAGVATWLIYGILLNAWPVIAANTATFILATLILALKIKYG
ncbi:MAG: SemiSWEET transporter [Nanoarchaeota archaeon]